MSELQKYEAGTIARIETPKEAARVKEMADAAAKFYMAQDDWATAQKAKEIAMRSARQAGALLAEVPRKPGERTDLTLAHRERRLKDVIEEAGLSPATAKRWQKLADISDEQLEQYFTEAHYKTWEYSIASLLRWASVVEGGKVEDYGIQNEESDIRVHVCPEAKVVYAYPTASGLKAIEAGSYEKKVVGNTAEGFLVPPKDIPNCRMVGIPDKIWDKLDIHRTDSTTGKGEKAVKLVVWLAKSGLLPLFTTPKAVTEKSLQIEGIDIVIEANLKIQVKCDFGGGDGGTGNLFIQTKESNPEKQY